MANFDGTGPQGAGPRTGKGMGNCTGGANRAYGCPRGRGGRGARGMGRGYRAYQGTQVITEKEEKEMLQDDAKYLEEELKAIKERLSEIK